MSLLGEDVDADIKKATVRLRALKGSKLIASSGGAEHTAEDAQFG